jgi:hypothetical protein
MTAALFIDIVFPFNRASPRSSPHFLAEWGFAFPARHGLVARAGKPRILAHTTVIRGAGR